MFGGFDFGLSVTDLMAQVTALISLPLVVALVAGSMSFVVVPRLLRLLYRTWHDVPSRFDSSDSNTNAWGQWTNKYWQEHNPRGYYTMQHNKRHRRQIDRGYRSRVNG